MPFSSNVFGHQIKYANDGSLYCLGYFNGLADLDDDPAVGNIIENFGSTFILKLTVDGNYVWNIQTTGS